MRFPKLLALATSFALTACGGSGGEVGGIIEDPIPPTPEPVLSPPEQIGLLDADYYAIGAALRGPTFTTLSAPARFPSETALRLDGFSNTMGSISVSPIDAEFEMKEDYAFGVNNTGHPNGIGGFGSDGAYGVYASFDPFVGQQMHVLMRRGELSSSNQLVGRWHSAWMAHGAGGGVGISLSTFFGTSDIDISDVVINTAGSVSAVPPVSIGYLVDNGDSS